MPKTRLVLRDNHVYVSHVSEAEKILIQSLPVRYYRGGQWIVPFESAFELAAILDGRCEIDPPLQKRLDLLQDVTKSKHTGLVLPEGADELKTKSYEHQDQFQRWGKYHTCPANLSEQGSGKSKMLLDWLTLKGCRHVLLVCRNSNVYKWAQEVKKHSDYEPFILKGTRQERTQALQRACVFSDLSRSGSIAIINYDYVGPFLAALSACKWDGISCDESTAIKSPRTKRHKALVKLGSRVKYRCILTGTPILNSPEDAYGQFRFLNPRILGQNHQGFRNRYITYGGYSGYQVVGYKNLPELSAKIDRFSFRVLKKDCLDLPPKIFEPLRLELTGSFREGYRQLVKATLLQLGDQLVDNTLAITKLNRCLQYCAGFMYVDSSKMEFTTHKTPKYQELIDFMVDHYQSHDKLIIWAYHRAVIRTLKNELTKAFPDVLVHLGSSELAANDRQDLIDSFNAPIKPGSKARCIILQTTAFMHGIDLRCDTAYYYQRSFSLEEWLQSQDRIHGINRGGEKCNYIISTMADTVEWSVHQALEKKKSLADLVIDKVNLGDLMRGEYE